MENYQDYVLVFPFYSIILLFQGQERIVSVETLVTGDFIKILPGAAVPVDGVIVEGLGHVDESAMTGESLPGIFFFVKAAFPPFLLSGSISL